MKEQFIEEYKAFLDNGKTERECVSTTITLARELGYVDLCEKENLVPGDKVYVVHRDKAIALFCIGEDDIENGMNILGAHIDSPRLDVKMKPLFEKDGVVYLNTHYYGGIKKYQWVTHPLAIHGTVFKKDGTCSLVVIGEDEDDTALCISDILPHLAQDQMKKLAGEFIPGENLDLVIGLNETPDEKDKGKNAILEILKERYDFTEDDFLSAELEVVPAGRARDLGLDRSMVLAYGQDDRVCAFTSLKALLDLNKAPKRTAVCILVDKEEIGSTGSTGMDSAVFANMCSELIAKLLPSYSELALRRALRNSYMLSSDVTAAFDPQYPELFDKQNASILAAGVVFNKYTGSRGKAGASDANPEFIALLRKTMDENNVTYQMGEMSKVDVGGGGTIAKFAAYHGMEVIDCGVPVISMHAPFEITAVKDVYEAYLGYKAFLTI